MASLSSTLLQRVEIRSLSTSCITWSSKDLWGKTPLISAMNKNNSEAAKLSISREAEKSALDCEQSLFCSKICKREYLSSEVVRVASARIRTNTRLRCSNTLAYRFSSKRETASSLNQRKRTHVFSNAYMSNSITQKRKIGVDIKIEVSAV